MSFRQAVRQFIGVPSEWSFRKMRMVPSRRRTVKYFGVSHVERLLEKLSLVSGKSGDPAAEPIIRLAAGASPEQEKEKARSVTLGPA
jgi:hypothetical protein